MDHSRRRSNQNYMKTTTSSSVLQTLLKVLIILISSGWVCLWLLKPTELWTKAWHKAEDKARNQMFGYQGLDFMVYSFPVIAVVVIGFIYMHLISSNKDEQRSRQKKISITNNLSNPVIVHGSLGVISGGELLAAVVFIIFLGWTMYAHISKDFNNNKILAAVKMLKLNIWQYKLMKLGTRFGLLAEACLALLLLPVARGISIFRVIGFQFEVSIKYHIFLGTAMIFFATLHGLITLFIWGIKHQLEDKIWMWQRTGRVYLAGEIGLVTGLIIWITSLPQIRRKKFELFYYTHHLYVVFLVFFLFHVGDRHFYMVLSGIVVFALDKLLRIIQSKQETCLVSACLLSSNAVELTLSKHPRLKYTPTSVIFLRVPCISKFQWHAFSITSSSTADDQKVTVLVRSQGWWTTSLYNIILANQVKCLPISVEGPYGPLSTEFLRYDSLLLIAGGIGVTPFLSILQEMGSCAQNSSPTRIQLIYATKKSQDINLLNSISHILLNQSINQLQLKVSIYVTQEEEREYGTMREWIKEMPKMQQTVVNFDPKSLTCNYTISGIESFLRMASVAGLSSKIFLLVLICLNHMFHQDKNPSWVTDVIIICSFVIATIFSTVTIAILRWRKMKKDISSPVYDQKQSKGNEVMNIEASGYLEEHQVFYGRRPDFEDIISKFPTQTGGSDIGVLVCGPELMKQSVASIIKKKSPGFTIPANRSQHCFNLHSLNFSL